MVTITHECMLHEALVDKTFKRIGSVLITYSDVEVGFVNHAGVPGFSHFGSLTLGVVVRIDCSHR